jgi:RHS repeat-associated protein
LSLRALSGAVTPGSKALPPSTTWTPGGAYRLGSQNWQDNTTWGANRINLPSGSSIAPGANATFSFNVTAPTSPGTYNFQWKMVQDGVEWFGAQSANVAVKVGVNDAAFVSQSVPPVMTPGQSYAVSVTMNNSGGKTWSSASGHRLGTQNPQDNSLWTGSPRVALPGTTGLGANAIFSFNVTAPSTPGTYNFQWKMVQDGVEWFGAQSANAAIKVGLDNAAFVSQTVPSTMAAGQSYAVSVTMQNTGSTTWAAGSVGLGSQNPQGNTTWGTSKINLASPVAPGAQTTFNFNVTAPSSPGTYNFQWRMLEGSNGWFGAQTTNVAVVVAGTAPDANVYFIHADHLNTPRLVANQSGQTVWRWDQAEPFGINPADENPSGLGNFDLPLRLPGQYFDKETNVQYNYFRDYDSAIGRYLESDPIGLNGGINTYLYVGGNPTGFVDPTGEALVQVIGGGIGLAFGAIQAANAAGGWSWSNSGAIAAGAAIGMVAGVASTFIPTAWSVYTSALAGGAMNATIAATGQYIATGNVQACTVIGAAAIGTLGGGIGSLALGAGARGFLNQNRVWYGFTAPSVYQQTISQAAAAGRGYAAAAAGAVQGLGMLAMPQGLGGF